MFAPAAFAEGDALWGADPLAEAPGWTPAQADAPGPAELDRAVAELRWRLARAGVVHEALGRLQNALGDRIGFGGRLDCEPEVASLLARVRVFGQAHRDAAQSARVQQERVAAIAAQETVRALVIGERADELERLAAAAALEVRRQREAASWQWRTVEKRDGLDRCSPTLAVADGLPGTSAYEAVAVLVLGEGVRLRPRGEHLPGAVVRR